MAVLKNSVRDETAFLTVPNNQRVLLDGTMALSCLSVRDPDCRSLIMTSLRRMVSCATFVCASIYSRLKPRNGASWRPPEVPALAEELAAASGFLPLWWRKPFWRAPQHSTLVGSDPLLAETVWPALSTFWQDAAAALAFLPWRFALVYTLYIIRHSHLYMC